MALLVAAVRMRFGGRQLSPGDEFEVPDEQASGIVYMRWANYRNNVAAVNIADELESAQMTKPGSGTYQRRDMEAEPPRSMTRTRRRYRRRDKVAQR